MTPFWRDLAERIVRTFVQAFLAGLLAGPVLDLSVPTVQAAALAALTAVATLVMGLLTRPIGDPDSPGVQAAALDDLRRSA